MHAVQYGNIEVVTQLIGHGATIHDENEVRMLVIVFAIVT